MSTALPIETTLACEEHFTIDYINDEPREYAFKDLSDHAKETARDKFRENAYNYDWWDGIYDDAYTLASLMGIDINTRIVNSYHGNPIKRLCIGFTGFFSQGDGAHFEGNWNPVKDPLASLTAVMEHAPQDTDLHEIAFDLALMSERCNKLCPDVYVSVTHSGHYSHEYCTSFDIELPTPDHIDCNNELQMMTWEALCAHNGLEYEVFEESIQEILRSFMRWIYSQLEAEHDYLMSDECIDEELADRIFDEDGNEL